MKKTKVFPSLFLVLILFALESCSVLSGKRTSNHPEESKIITSDITNFYEAFDLAIKDTANAQEIFEKYYFDKGSRGLKDFYKSKIRSKEKFSDFVIAYKDFYQSIRKDIADVNDLKKEIFKNFKEFERLYSQAQFPDVYFLIGRFTSNGTISKNGILIGTEILVRTKDSHTENWNRDILRISMLRNHIPVTVTHELVHFNQDRMKNGNTLLWKSIREGSAEFITELISGKTDANYHDFKGREIEIWKDFKKEKNKNIWNSWQQASELRPRNAGYWAGYMICKAYYQKIQNKERVISDILRIKDYNEFLKKSKVNSYIQRNFK